MAADTKTFTKIKKIPRECKSHGIPVLLLPSESQTVVFQLLDVHLRKFKKFITKKVLSEFYFHNHIPTLAPNLKFSNEEYSVKDNGGSRIKRYSVVISILSCIQSIFRIYKPRSL